MVDDGRWIRVPGFNLRGAENFRRRSVRLVNPFVGQLRQFRTPATYIITARIEFFALADGIEHAKVRCGARATAAGLKHRLLIVMAAPKVTVPAWAVGHNKAGQGRQGGVARRPCPTLLRNEPEE